MWLIGSIGDLGGMEGKEEGGREEGRAGRRKEGRDKQDISSILSTLAASLTIDTPLLPKQQ